MAGVRASVVFGAAASVVAADMGGVASKVRVRVTRAARQVFARNWGIFLGDVPAVTAILDRFLAHVVLVQMTGKSYRLDTAR